MDWERTDHRVPLSEDYLREHTVGELRPWSGLIRLVNYDSEWPHKFEREAERIRTALGERALRIEHVGSTSVPELPAKLIIDIVLGVAKSDNEPQYAGALELAGYRLEMREPGYEHRTFKGNSVNLHVFSGGCPEIERIVGFRDWLRTSKEDRESVCPDQTCFGRTGVEIHSELYRRQDRGGRRDHAESPASRCQICRVQSH